MSAVQTHSNVLSEQGLTQAQVNERVEKGQINAVLRKTGKTYKEIFIKNICTFFNRLVFCRVLHDIQIEFRCTNI